jgi:hypothetical protein
MVLSPLKGESLLPDPKPVADWLTQWGAFASIVSAIVALISLGIAFYQFGKRKSHDDTLNGFLNGIKPTIQDAARGQSFSATHWQDVLEQIHDMMARLQPRK